MLWPVCLGCFSSRDLSTGPGNHRLCSSCLDELDELCRPTAVTAFGGPPLIDITSLFSYRGLVRRLILRAKVGGDLRALQLLLSLVASHPATAPLIAWADGLMPCASSLWGRIRGRIDIASQICQRQGGPSCPTLAAPLHLHWRWRKQARLNRRDRHHTDMAMPEWFRGLDTHLWQRSLARTGTTRLLLVDDIVTSGDTLRQTALATQTGPSWMVRGLTLAVS